MPREEQQSHTPAGEHQQECPNCGVVFRTDNWRVKYCSATCKTQAANKRYYQRHRRKIIDKVIERRKKD